MAPRGAQLASGLDDATVAEAARTAEVRTRARPERARSARTLLQHTQHTHRGEQPTGTHAQGKNRDARAYSVTWSSAL
jgi:hypothetical protein